MAAFGLCWELLDTVLRHARRWRREGLTITPAVADLSALHNYGAWCGCAPWHPGRCFACRQSMEGCSGKLAPSTAGMCAYAWGNNIFNNPGITYSKGHRMDQEKRDNDPNSLARSKRYTSGIFRRLGDVRGPRICCLTLDTCSIHCST